MAPSGCSKAVIMFLWSFVFIVVFPLCVDVLCLVPVVLHSYLTMFLFSCPDPEWGTIDQDQDQDCLAFTSRMNKMELIYFHIAFTWHSSRVSSYGRNGFVRDFILWRFLFVFHTCSGFEPGAKQVFFFSSKC